jgi:hypothetical protein
LNTKAVFPVPGDDADDSFTWQKGKCVTGGRSIVERLLLKISNVKIHVVYVACVRTLCRRRQIVNARDARAVSVQHAFHHSFLKEQLGAHIRKVHEHIRC